MLACSVLKVSPMSKKLGFSAVLGLVMGSQIGSGVFMLPAGLAPYGYYGLMGWVISGIGAICLALVFAHLCANRPRTGGPHVYTEEAFGSIAGFFTGWTYWFISWVSSTAVIVTCIGYLTPILGELSPNMRLGLEIGLLFSIVLINLRGVEVAGEVELLLTVLKVIPLVALPLIALFYFDSANLAPTQIIETKSPLNILTYVTLLTLWGFIGLECATTPAGAVENPSKTIPKAIVIGTFFVALIYFLNSLGVMGVIPAEALANSKAPYADVAKHMFGDAPQLVISIIAFIVCVGTLNAWVLASGQIALGLAEDKLFPKFFAKRNKQDAPYFAILSSSIGIVPLLILTNQDNIAQQINYIIDLSVLSFLYVYVACAFALLKSNLKQSCVPRWVIFTTTLALGFCLWIIFNTNIESVLTSSLFTLAGLPLFLSRFRSISRKAVIQ